MQTCYSNNCRSASLCCCVLKRRSCSSWLVLDLDTLLSVYGAWHIFEATWQYPVVFYVLPEDYEKGSGWFFEVCLHQAALPKLYSKIENETLSLLMESPVAEMPFPMPVEVKIGGKRQRIQIPADGITIQLAKKDKPVVDPDGWLLFEIGQ